MCAVLSRNALETSRFLGIFCLFCTFFRFKLELVGFTSKAMLSAVLGVKNHLFAGPAAGGKTTAILMTLVQTCRLLEIDPKDYLADVLERLPSTSHKDIAQFLPDQWKALRNIRSATTAEPENMPMTA
jgi:hypothetical protein